MAQGMVPKLNRLQERSAFPLLIASDLEGGTSIRFNGGSGPDRFENKTSRPARMIGGTGNDTLIGGTGLDRAEGNKGSDTCVAEVETSCEL